ncbi:MAG: hypothetical protein WBV69_20380, partial [Candidatus Sulfotelmatobacter sp.]
MFERNRRSMLRNIQLSSLLKIACILVLIRGCFGSSAPTNTSEVVASIDGLSVAVQPADGTYEIQTG